MIEDGAKTLGREPDYSELVKELGGSPEERCSLLEGYIEPTAEERAERRKVPTAALRAIADLVHDGLVRVVVSTNFDRLLENALRDRGVEPNVVDSVDALAGAEPLTYAACYLVKLHDDYKDARFGACLWRRHVRCAGRCGFRRRHRREAGRDYT